MDHHATLGVSQDVSPEELKKAYRKKAFSTHPDRNDGNDEDFKKVTEAYEILTGKRQERQPPPPPPGGMPFDMQDLLNNLRGQTRRTTIRDSKPPLSEEEIVLNIQTSVSRARQGQDISITYHLAKDCISCNGLGGEGKAVCARCEGYGYIVYQQNHGEFVYKTQSPCSHCRERGFQFKKLCGKCNGNGWTVHEKKCIFELKEKK